MQCGSLLVRWPQPWAGVWARSPAMSPSSISITTSCYPLPSICVRDPVSDWFGSLAQCLHWNVRKRQAHFAEDEDEDADAEDGEG